MSREYEYEPTEIEDELFLSEVPLKILEQSIESQFDDPLEYRKRDYIQSFITKYEFSVNNLYEEEKENLEELHAEFISFITRIFENRLSIGFPDIEDMDEDTQHELIHMTYCFFIKNIKKNFVNLILNYIDENKDRITEEDRDALFLSLQGKRMTGRQIRELVKKYTSIGMKTSRGEGYSPHKLRATAATSLIGRGNSIYDVAALLDHEQVTTTQLYARQKNNVKRDLVHNMEWEKERREGVSEVPDNDDE